MKKILLLTALIFAGLIIQAQNHLTHKISKEKEKLSLKRPYQKGFDQTINFLSSPRNPYVKSVLDLEEQIGETRYDLQSNQSVANRIYLYSDGTIGACWTRGLSDASFPDRGTGYNYYDGSTWGAMPSARIEPLRTGWPSYAPLGANGEIVVSHTDASGLDLERRSTKGSGTWTHSILAGPAGAVDISWPRAVTSGADHNKIHVLACTYSAYQSLNLALLYYRSSDGGATWDKQHIVLPGMAYSDYEGFGGDSYAWAEPKGDTIAFVCGDNWTDLFMMKSNDGGENWTKTVIFQHPYPHFKETHTLVLDTPTVCDGSIAVALDNVGKAHVTFGVMKVLNSDTTDAQTSYFPYTDGLGYWNEDMGTMTNISVDNLELNNRLVGYVQDLNNNDTLDITGVATYYLSLSSMPNMMIDGGNNIHLVYAGVREYLNNGNQNYRHIMVRHSSDNGSTWTPINDITSALPHNFDECVFPNVAPHRNNKCHLIFQADEEPGLAVRGDSDPYTDNRIVYTTFDPVTGISNPTTPEISVQSFPNPAKDMVFIKVNTPEKVNLNLQVVNLAGKVVFNNQLSAINGSHLLKINTAGWKPGIYFYQLKSDYQSYTGKIVIY